MALIQRFEIAPMPLSDVTTDDLIAELRKRRGHYDPLILHSALHDQHALPVRDAVAKAFDILGEIYGERGSARISAARFACYVLLRERGLSLPEITAVTSRKHHGAVIHGMKRAQSLEKHDPYFACNLDHARRLLATDTKKENPHGS